MSRCPKTIVHPTAACRCCMRPVHTFWQPNFYDDDGKLFVHCVHEDCPLYFATRELQDWLTMDLKQWDATQHPQWTMPKDLLEVA